MTAAPTSRYPVTAHWSARARRPRSSLIEGSRMLTAEVLALTTNVETQLVPSTPAVATPAADFEVVTAVSVRTGGRTHIVRRG